MNPKPPVARRQVSSNWRRTPGSDALSSKKLCEQGVQDVTFFNVLAQLRISVGVTSNFMQANIET